MAQSELVTTAFETTVDDDHIHTLHNRVEEVVQNLRQKVDSDSRLDDILRDGSNQEYIKRADTITQERPEPLTEDLVIEPLFDALGFDTDEMGSRVGDLADSKGQEADYDIWFGSDRILIEAEPLNKNLDWKNVGVDQVESWLENKKFDTEYGIATNGIQWVLLRYDEDTYDCTEISRVDLRSVFLSCFAGVTGKKGNLSSYSQDILIESQDGQLIKNFISQFGQHNLKQIVSEAQQIIQTKQEKVTEQFYDDYIQIVFGVVDEDTGKTTDRCLIKNGVTGPKSVPQDEWEVRLFSVSLMNRIIFIKFLEDKGIAEPNLLRSLVSEHRDGNTPGTFYKSYIYPLFGKVLNTKRSERDSRVKNLDQIHSIPYLNGGLFHPTVPDEDRYDVSDSVLTEIIELLERYTFSTSGGIESLDPSVLGNVFEKTINYLAGEEGQQKEELGAYYTPDEITRFVANHTVEPVILDKLKTVLVDRGWNKVDVDQFETSTELVTGISPSTELVDELLETIDDVRVVDPACGSGHFLTSVLGEITQVRKELHRKVNRDFSEMNLKKRTVMNNIYGVDIVPPAVEITKLRLWLSIISELKVDEVERLNDEEIALPNTTFNFRQGNSLIGITSTELRSGGQSKISETNILQDTPTYCRDIQQARTTHDKDSSIFDQIEAVRNNINTSLDDIFLQTIGDFTYEDEFVFQTPTQAIQEIQSRSTGCRVSKVGFHTEESLKDTPESYLTQLDSNGIRPYKWKANMNLSDGLNKAEIQRFETALAEHPNAEAISKVFVERTIGPRDLHDLDRIHWIAEFPEVIELAESVTAGDNGDSDGGGGGDCGDSGDGKIDTPTPISAADADFGFDVIVGNPPFGAEIDGLYEKITEQDQFFTCHGANNSAEYFTEQAIQLCKDGGRIGFVLPKTMSYYDSWSDIRELVFDKTNIISLFDNGLAFHDVDYEEMTLIISPEASKNRTEKQSNNGSENNE